MPWSNNPDIALAQEWFADLDRHIAAHGLRGYDPFDIKQHPWLRAAQTRPLLRKASSVLCDVFPTLSRRALHIAPTENPKAFALTALGALRAYQLWHDPRHLALAQETLAWLESNVTPGYAGPCWGYPFDIKAIGLETPRGTPVLVISAIAGFAFLLAHEVTGEARYLNTVRGIAEFIQRDLTPIPEENGAHCLPYTPTDRRRVHNASLLGVELLVRVARLRGEAALLEHALPALRFTLAHQHDDGAWFYGEYRTGEPYERAILEYVDHFHTGFVLRSLHNIAEALPDTHTAEREACHAALKKGFNFYKAALHVGHQFQPVNQHAQGLVKKQWPIDIHMCAESLLCPSVVKDVVLPARGMAPLCLKWAHWNLRDPATGLPWYRKYPFFTSKITFPRWGTAWMYFALAEYLFRHQDLAD